MFLNLAYGMANQGEAGAQGFSAFMPLIFIFVIFYFLLIRPQQRKAKQHRELLKDLKAGDRVVTTGGLHGKIIGLADTIVTLEIADKVRVKVSRSQISGISELKASVPKKKSK
jgi:preprotein translocase subunit YajC